ncbi:uncharacterized protein L201_007437 [Kwoniella dendrophila CBS 6074]|uniref:F-box domain-containing protein n=1 Tax=Kwoniella dendrophila CBS 6074 TaxID=1295534 RepID=A0AAX4K5T0_9TREE
MTPRPKTANVAKQASTNEDTSKRVSGEKAITPGKNKKATPSKKTNRTPLQEQESNEAVPEEEIIVIEDDDNDDDKVVADDESVKPQGEKKLSPFPNLVLKRILKYCLEDEVDGCYVAQNTLATALRVNSLFFEIAGRILYKQPTVINLESFFLGSHRSLRNDQFYFLGPQDGKSMKEIMDEAFGGKDTKLPLLEHTQHLRIYSCLVPKYKTGGKIKEVDIKCIKDLTKKTSRYSNGKIYNATKKQLDILETRNNDHLTPDCTKISIGSLKRFNYKSISKDLSNDNQLVKDMIKLENDFGKGIEKLRSRMWQYCKPFKWIEYQNHLTGFFKPRNINEYYEIDELWERQRRGLFLPEDFIVHTNLLDPFSVIWGSDNHIVLRKPMDEDLTWNKIRKRALKETQDPIIPLKDDDDLQDIVSEDEDLMPEIRPKDELYIQNPRNMESSESIRIISNTISRFNPLDFAKPAMKPDVREEVENNAIFYIYGFEKLYPPSQETLDNYWDDRENIIKEWGKTKKFDLEYIEGELKVMGYPILKQKGTPTQQEKSKDNSATTNSSSSLSRAERKRKRDEQKAQAEIQAEAVLNNSREHASRDTLENAKMIFWLFELEYKVFTPVEYCWRGIDRGWTNGMDCPGPRIRARLQKDLNSAVSDGGGEENGDGDDNASFVSDYEDRLRLMLVGGDS